MKWGHSKQSRWEPALVQNYASANVSCWSADSREEINRRWKREDPQSKETLEKESSLWDWLHLQGVPSHTNHLDRACQLPHTCICLVPSERLIMSWEWSSHTSRVCAGNATGCFSIAQLCRSSCQRHWAHHQPSRLVPPEGNWDVQFQEAPCPIITPERSLLQSPAKRADVQTEVTLLQLGGNRDNHSKCML